MKILKISLALFVIAGVAAVVYFALADIRVEQKEVVKDIPRERFAPE